VPIVETIAEALENSLEADEEAAHVKRKKLIETANIWKGKVVAFIKHRPTFDRF